MPEALIVDDSKVMREMVVACLRAYPGLAFTHAASGLEALERLSLKPFDLVVLDLNMPDIGGYRGHRVHPRPGQAARACRSWSSPRAATTARETRALAAGATRFMTKPFSPDGLLGEVRALLDRARESRR